MASCLWANANNIARSLGIAGTPAELVEQWRVGHVHSFHLVEATYGKDIRELCTEGFGVGLMGLKFGIRLAVVASMQRAYAGANRAHALPPAARWSK